MSSIKFRSYAKINLSLKILGLRGDGFHDIESVMQTVSLCDELEFSDIKSGIEIVCDDKDVPVDEKNICYKAAELIGRGRGIRIRITKNIPTQAGLGGGSSNGAATLLALNKMWGLKLSEKELIEMAAQVGSDVPFFMVGGRCLCRGRGEIVEKGLQGRQEEKEIYIIVKPAVSVPTKWAYEEWDRAKDVSPSALQCSNDLEQVIIPKYPIIAQLKKDLLAAGCSLAQMTGSGSAVYGTVENRGIGDRVTGEMKKRYNKVYLVQKVDKGAEFTS